jgi:guanylate kinase
MQEGKVIIFSAPSGAGKTTIVRYLIEHNPILAFSVSATTRARRAGETDGKDYYFLTKNDFEQKIADNQFVEYEEVYEGTYYGTLKAEIERIWASGKHVIIDADVQGGINMKKFFGEKALSIFIIPPSVEILEQRLRSRSTDSEESIRKRIDKAAYEMSFGDKFDKSIYNDNLNKACAEAQELLDNFIGKTH